VKKVDTWKLVFFKPEIQALTQQAGQKFGKKIQEIWCMFVFPQNAVN